MDVRFLPNPDASAALLKLIASCDRCAFAVAWAGRNRVATSLLQHARKTKHGVIGTHLYRTSPDLLRDFIGSTSVRYMPPNGKLFHPKAYVFWHDNKLSVVVGSHNLTASAFEGRNVEASMMFTGEPSDPTLRNIVEFIESAWKSARPIEDDNFLFSYELQHRANQRRIAALESFRMAKRPRDRRSPSPLTMTWKTFVDGVRDDQYSTEEKRSAILKRARELFLQHGLFSRMPQVDRRAIAGTFGRVELQSSDLDWGCFGTMFGQGDFKNLVNQSPSGLSSALDHIPMSGDVSEAQYVQFATRFREAFDDKAHKGGVATASRLLAMKRPDWFVAVNNANRNALCAALGIAPTTLTLDNYWPSIVVPITLSVWWNHPRPASRADARIWDYRAALLDSLFYKPI